ncbi:hypothetical protein PTSG_00940 [Salpingoeca rosetta]|uniref:Vacuolar ATPase assembly protein VMA22 n=1 Tax=Salpingoeca rosetta (strain ATCC 50818 / BSB-021) TaxID=946362 RepID=F2TXY0_SALR5|nr:uncharacterized protein PTSG_00940 [Salpingoeca rosetta]EGD76239.1 hypothetical protein PTSG_00940 [Salpingoeca rosetta]|eukprot:XP_004998414.1 hypothetical protein PTSG_00940 [Salpingoeca rosetta]
MSANDDDDRVEQQLDELLDLYMDLYTQYTATMNDLQLSMKDGFLWVSKTRKSLGYDRISPLQYPRIKTATAHVTDEEDMIQAFDELSLGTSSSGSTASDGAVGASRNTAADDAPASTLRQRRKGGSKNPAPSDGGSVKSSKSQPGKKAEVKQRGDSEVERKKREKVVKERDSDEEGEDGDKGAKQPASSQRGVNSDHHDAIKAEIAQRRKADPLRWFAGLPPPALRSSQRHFKQSVDAVVELARIKTEMDAVARAYRQLQLSQIRA